MDNQLVPIEINTIYYKNLFILILRDILRETFFKKYATNH